MGRWCFSLIKKYLLKNAASGHKWEQKQWGLGGGRQKGWGWGPWGLRDVEGGGRVFRQCSKSRLPFSWEKQGAQRKRKTEKAGDSVPASSGHLLGTRECEGRLQHCVQSSHDTDTLSRFMFLPCAFRILSYCAGQGAGP